MKLPTQQIEIIFKPITKNLSPALLQIIPPTSKSNGSLVSLFPYFNLCLPRVASIIFGGSCPTTLCGLDHNRLQLQRQLLLRIRVHLQWPQQKLPILPHLPIPIPLQHGLDYLGSLCLEPVSSLIDKLGLRIRKLQYRSIGDSPHHLLMFRSVLSRECQLCCPIRRYLPFHCQQHLSSPLNMPSSPECEQH